MKYTLKSIMSVKWPEGRPKAKKFYQFCSSDYPYRFDPYKNTVECQWCHGSGRIVHLDKRPDPVEGYKMADRITCPTCGGDGRRPVSDAREEYKKYQTLVKKQQGQYDEEKEIAQQALVSFTQAEIKILYRVF